MTNSDIKTVLCVLDSVDWVGERFCFKFICRSGLRVSNIGGRIWE